MKSLFFFFNDTATTEIYTLSLHDALPIFARGKGVIVCSDVEASDQAIDAMLVEQRFGRSGATIVVEELLEGPEQLDRKSTRLNSSHSQISYAVFCLKKKKSKNLLLSLTTSPPVPDPGTSPAPARRTPQHSRSTALLPSYLVRILSVATYGNTHSALS